MSGVKHTPGKWLAAAKPSSVVGWPVVAAPMGQVICDVAIINKKPDHVSDGEFSAYYAQVEANARLIAAAPDLFEAGVGLLKAYRSAVKMCGDDALDLVADHPESWASKMEAALSKATTQQEGR
ncbi:hypothetical protein [Brevundimonas naejangsanensis]|uniref:hypothetical protein n=1 Tax=Brevundimonas naejangsanensis TaxID=588932 RepID=UPI0026EB5B6C|nr:hypothetical protein [Brevundimonas naejangsanensis]